jgi:predicted pyridoxine 5'-phosphate oxidase superfamily flavin-nucleotide-binding protein
MRFHAGELEVQERAGVRDAAAEVGDSIADFVTDRARDTLEHRRMAVLGTVDSRGRAWASVIAGEPGFITVPDPRTVRLGKLPPAGDPLIANLANEAHAALLAVDFVNPRRVRINGRGSIDAGAIRIRTEQVYGNCRRYIQERLFLGLREQSDVPGTPVRSHALAAAQREQIAKADTFFIASDHPERGADVSHKGGDPGFVRVVDDSHFAWPDYNGNSMFNTLGNLTINPRAGLLFIDFDSGRTLQLTGLAAIDWNPEHAQAFPGAERVVTFAIEEVIDNAAGFPLVTKFRQPSRFNPRP